MLVRTAASAADVERVCATSSAIFGTDVEDETHGLPAWRSRVETMGGRIYFVEGSDGAVLGFVFVHDHATRPKTTHIWIAGTHPSARRSGIMRHLFQHCRNECASQDFLTVNTYPDKFPNMPPFLAVLGYNRIDIEGDKHCYALALHGE
ncbi:hypothetical protein ACHHYP_03729 [Achlya hypogyna]|uniref:N-acetyltransferase domain-containing protein n=1 Tax=Achlya hypogyna TaxID=1202772 RepID=A0A1V9Z3H2_ACHHY|nr:hypothetical protein ACHHYP_03729 [Achlya hypogyna]